MLNIKCTLISNVFIQERRRIVGKVPCWKVSGFCFKRPRSNPVQTVFPYFIELFRHLNMYKYVPSSYSCLYSYPCIWNK